MSQLVEVAEGFRLDEPTPTAAVLSALARAVRPGQPPDWLLPTQIRAFYRGVEIAERFGGVMVALPVGTGKTYVSLAVAQWLGGGEEIGLIVPAILRPQWLRVAKELDISVTLQSHEAASRGQAPRGGGPVIIDESHRFRTPSTRRYRTIAPALVGRRVVLATATPIVNRVDDLVAQLLLAVADDALARHGFPSLKALPWRGAEGAALEALIVREATPGAVPATDVRRIPAPADPRLAKTVARVRRLRLARDPAVAQLLRVSMLRALASSPAALSRVVDRYRRLLGHAQRAGRAGHPVNRRAILTAVGADLDQLLLWELLPTETAAGDLAVADFPTLGALARSLARWQAAGDRKVAVLKAIVADRRPTVVFTSSRATAEFVRQALPVAGVAWVTGARAGLGAMRISRAAALGGFDSAYPWVGGRRPWLLVATDVAAEGLNLDLVSRVIHYDLPWTAVRLTQRVGRATRLSSTHARVEVVQFEVPGALEAAVALEGTLERKAALPAMLDAGGSAEVGPNRLDSWAHARAERGWAVVALGKDLAAIRMGSGRPTELWARASDGGWRPDPTLVAQAVAALDEAPTVDAPDPGVLAAARAELARDLARAAIDREIDGLTAPRRPPPGIRDVERWGAKLVRARQWTEAAGIDGALRFLRRAHRAGEALIARAAGGNDLGARRTANQLGEVTGAHPQLVAIVLVDRVPDGA